MRGQPFRLLLVGGCDLPRSWLVEAPADPTDPDAFALSCVLCMSFAKAHPDTWIPLYILV